MSPTRSRDGNGDNILGKKFIRSNIDPVPAETDKGTLQDISRVRKTNMDTLGLENPIAHQDKLPVMRHRRVEPRHRVAAPPVDGN